MNNEEARRIVKDGLERRKKLFAEHEAALDQYEQDMIECCNEHCADAKFQRRLEVIGKMSRDQAEARRAARAEALAKELERDEAAGMAIKRYGMACLGVLWLTAFTKLPMWAAIALIIGGAVFPASYIFRLYYPLEVTK